MFYPEHNGANVLCLMTPEVDCILASSQGRWEGFKLVAMACTDGSEVFLAER